MPPVPPRTSAVSLPARTVMPPQQPEQPPPPPPGSSAQPPHHDAPGEDLNWGSEDEEDLTGAMGGLNL